MQFIEMKAQTLSKSIYPFSFPSLYWNRIKYCPLDSITTETHPDSSYTISIMVDIIKQGKKEGRLDD